MVGRSLTSRVARAHALLVLIVSAFLGGRAEAARDAGADMCRSAAQQVSTETGVPVDVLNAISLTETGRKRNGSFAPWPWTVNMEGAGHWFDTAQEALAYTLDGHAKGKRSFDVGCFQLNYNWHGHAFESIEQMFDPIANARYAADFLSRLYAETGSWSAAAGAYHSRTPEYANRYRKIFDRHYAALSEGGPTVVANANSFVDEPDDDLAAEPMRQNNDPLLIASNETGRMGSLVPLGSSGGNRFIPLQPARALH